MMFQEDYLVTVVMVAGLFFLPFLVWTPWVNIGDDALLGHPYLISVFWSIGPFNTDGAVAIELFPIFTTLGFLFLTFPNMIFAYATISYSKQVATNREVIIAGFVGPILYLLFGLPSTLFFMSTGEVVINLPLPLLQVLGAAYLIIRPSSSRATISA
jgi:hypothetical protein